MMKALIVLAALAALPLGGCKLQTGGVTNGADVTGGQKPAEAPKPAPEQPKTP